MSVNGLDVRLSKAVARSTACLHPSFTAIFNLVLRWAFKAGATVLETGGGVGAV